MHSKRVWIFLGDLCFACSCLTFCMHGLQGFSGKDAAAALLECNGDGNQAQLHALKWQGREGAPEMTSQTDLQTAESTHSSLSACACLAEAHTVLQRFERGGLP